MKIKFYFVGISLIVLLNSSLCHVFGTTKIECTHVQWLSLDKKTRTGVTLYEEAEALNKRYCFNEESNTDNKYHLNIRLIYLKDALLKTIKSQKILEEVTPLWNQISNKCEKENKFASVTDAEEWINYTFDNLQFANTLITKLNTCISNIDELLKFKEEKASIVKTDVEQKYELNSCQEKQITIFNESLEKIKNRYDNIELDSLEESCNLEEFEYALNMNDLKDSKKIYNETISKIRKLNLFSIALSKIALSVMDLQLSCKTIFLTEECNINDNHCKITEEDLTQKSLNVPIEQTKECIKKLEKINKKSIFKIQSFSETLTM